MAHDENSKPDCGNKTDGKLVRGDVEREIKTTTRLPAMDVNLTTLPNNADHFKLNNNSVVIKTEP